MKEGFNSIESKNIGIQVLDSSDSFSDPLMINLDSNMVNYFNSYNENKKIKGYRIQLYSGSSRKEAEEVRTQFMNKYEVRPQLMYIQPNFKIRVGNYRDRMAASKDLLFYKIEFQSAFLVRDFLTNQSEQ